MNTERYKHQLLELERDLSDRTRSETALGRDQTADSARDSGDAGAAGEAASEDFTEAEMNSTVLKQVREALARLDEGTFGQCVVDGEPIEEKRLDAVPWSAYCLKHQAELDARSDRKLPTM